MPAIGSPLVLKICKLSFSREWVRLKPENAGRRSRINAGLLPPCRLIAMTVDLAMMAAAERYREFVAHLAAKRPILGKAQMMRVGRRAGADQTGLRGDEPHVFAVTYPTRLGMS
jgi:hypothetical protein